MPIWLANILRKVGVYLIPILFDWLKGQIIALFQYLQKKNEERKAKAEALKKYEAVVKNPEATQEEKDRAKAEFLNS